MKQLFLSLSLCCLFGAAAQAAAVSGTVMSVATCSPVSGQKVYLSDTLMQLVDSAVTNSSGAYTMTFPSAWPNPLYYLVSTASCGAVARVSGKYTGVNATANVFVCGTPKTLYGTLMLGSTVNTGAAKVYLITVRRNYPTAGDTTLNAVDSVELTNSGNFTFTRACAPSDTFLVKAALLPAHPNYTSWLPSYDSSLNWSTATRYYGASFAPGIHHLYMFAGTNPGGPGFVGGSVLVGANKTAAVGDPLAARLMILVNGTTNAPVAYTYSDATGKFSFPSVAAGTYKLFGDSWGLYNVPLTVVVSSSNLHVGNIIFEENYGENTFKGRFGTVSVSGVGGPLAGVSAYPNPATKQISLTGMNDIRGSKHVAIRNIIGVLVMAEDFADGKPVDMAVDALPAGTYVLQLITEEGSASFKVVK